MSDAVLSQLVEAESELAFQATSLSSQLSAIQEKRKGLQTVIDMFQSPSTPSRNGDAVTGKILDQNLSMTLQASAHETEDDTAEDNPATPAGRRPLTRVSREPKATRVPRKTATSPKAESASVSPATEEDKLGRKPRGGKSPNWQRYVQEPYRKTPLPDVVANILNAQPNDAFKIADVMAAIFKEEMPKTTFLKARNRVSNILSAGARTGEWKRGRGGRYSISEKALN